MKKTAKLGFRFYGSGNVGDDLMLEGFLTICPAELSLFGVTDESRIGILKRRFPRIRWLLPHEEEPTYQYWLGVGDTPFQCLSGDYFVRQLEEDILPLPPDVTVALIGVGVEEESIQYRERFQKIISRTQLITTRDQTAYTFLSENFDTSNTRIEATADLAHLFLQKPSLDQTESRERIFDLGLNLYNEGVKRIPTLRIYWQARKLNHAHKLLFLSNEFRNFKGSEVNSYQTYGFLSGAGLARQYPPLITPAYFSKSSESFTEIFGTINCLASSRYHCILMGAWLGCKCLGITRSSKIQSLCRELEVDLLTATQLSKNLFDYQKLPFKPVDRSHLATFALSASLNREYLHELTS